MLAIKATQNCRITTIVAAARSFNVPRTALADRMKGIPYLYEARGTGHKFTQLEEESIQDWFNLYGSERRLAYNRDVEGYGQFTA